jgi:hypothetical protein
MFHPAHRTLCAAATALTLAAAALPAHADGPVLLTVTGDIEHPNRGAMDPDIDKLFAFNDISFEKAAVFDLDTMEELPQTTVRADFPKGGETVEFTGPLLADVLDAAGAEGETVTVRAMDGYAVEVPLDDLVEKGAVVALARDGKAFGIGDFGPTQIVFPRGERAELAAMPDDWWVWQIYHIAVE